MGHAITINLHNTRYVFVFFSLPYNKASIHKLPTESNGYEAVAVLLVTNTHDSMLCYNLSRGCGRVTHCMLILFRVCRV